MVANHATVILFAKQRDKASRLAFDLFGREVIAEDVIENVTARDRIAQFFVADDKEGEDAMEYFGVTKAQMPIAGA